MAKRYTLAELQKIKEDQQNQLDFETANPILESAQNIMSGRLPSETVGGETPIESIAATPTVTERPAPSQVGGPTPDLGSTTRGIGVVLTQFDFEQQAEAGDVTIPIDQEDPFANVEPVEATPEESKGLLQSTVTRGSIDRTNFAAENLKQIPAAI